MQKVGRISRRSKRSRRKKKHTPWIINYQCYLTFITGCYTCQWKVQKEKRLKHEFCCCSRREQIFCLFLIFSAGLSVLLLFLWLESSNEFMGFDWVVYLGTGFWFFWSIVVLSIFGILTAYSLLLLLLGFLLIWEGYELHLHWFHKVLILLILLAELFLLWLLFTYWRERWLTVGLSLQVFAPFIHLICICVMTVLSWPTVSYLIHLEREVQSRRYQMIHYGRKTRKSNNVLVKLRAMQVAVGLPFLSLLLCVYIIPIGKYSPCIQEKDKLGPKPDFFGHRGAPMLGPENTMMSFEKAVEQGAFGLETDIYVSYDGVPFLMHDYDLRRTTNIMEVLPNAAFLSGSSFTWNFLSTLNAGKWFLRSPPFYNMEPLSEADSEKARNQTIPKLSEFLELARKEKKFVMFDLHHPPVKHPFRGRFIRETVQVFWLPGLDRTYVRNKAPGFQQVGRFIPVEALAKQKIRIINVDYKRLFSNGLRDYKEANITINLYIVNEPWLYSLAWCSSIHSVTTDNIQNLRHIKDPYFFMTPGNYRFWWILLDSISVISIIAIFYYHWWKNSKKELFKATGTSIDTQSINLQRGKSDNQETSTPSRVREIPWTIASLYPTLTQDIKNYPGTRHFSIVPKKKTKIEPEPVKENMSRLTHAQGGSRPTAPMRTVFDLTQSASWAATHPDALPIVSADEPSVSSTEVFHSATQSTKNVSTEPSQESSYVLLSSASSLSLSSFWLSSSKK
ncbi:glycerophosphodiester phosphodiesterase domain-containing protein 4 isoform X2 [Talpa occidentalis]|uniref:glycerophosphodiester phosphodiesterase domain-containing protein 4 isoform X2 n=1 Tax=Talpa occidentalis TaxID=50954 RepID=UPI00188E61E0|nr:glycerophosphodiester phosphodiesterase domain-containing protein 4 isoform X2 [Talpa occidentalis]